MPPTLSSEAELKRHHTAMRRRPVKAVAALAMLWLVLGTSPASAKNLKPASPGWKVRLSASGDLVPGGGKELALLRVFECTTPETCGKLSYREVNIVRGPKWTLLATLDTSPNFAITSLSVTGKRLSVSGYQPGPGDAACCPSAGWFEVWELQSGTWIRVEGGGTL
jgi:hypothetical protein